MKLARNITLTIFSLLTILYVLVQSGYIDIERATFNYTIYRQAASGDSILFAGSQTSNYLGLPDSRIADFEADNKTNSVKYIISKINNDSRYHEFSIKTVKVSLQVRELLAQPSDTFTVRLDGQINGFCSPQSAKELTQLVLAKFEYGQVE